jgi:hypothetical protein
MKLWILRNPDKTPGQGPTRQDKKDRASVSSALTTSTGKRAWEDNDDDDMKDDGGNQEGSSWGRNRDNPALGGHQRKTEN